VPDDAEEQRGTPSASAGSPSSGGGAEERCGSTGASSSSSSALLAAGGALERTESEAEAPDDAEERRGAPSASAGSRSSGGGAEERCGSAGASSSSSALLAAGCALDAEALGEPAAGPLNSPRASCSSPSRSVATPATPWRSSRSFAEVVARGGSAASGAAAERASEGGAWGQRPPRAAATSAEQGLGRVGATSSKPSMAWSSRAGWQQEQWQQEQWGSNTATWWDSSAYMHGWESCQQSGSSWAYDLDGMRASGVETKQLCQFYIGIEDEPKFQVKFKVLGPRGKNVKDIVEATGAKLRLRGRGSGFLEGDDRRESTDELMLCVSAPEEGYQEAVRLVTELLLKIYEQHRAFCRKSGAPASQHEVQMHVGPRMGSR